jgi:hypothetical protein
MIIKPKIMCWKTLEDIEDGYYTTEKHYQPLEHKWHDVTIHHDYKEAPFDDLHKDAIVQELVRNCYLIAGDTHQNKAIPLFNDGYILVSMRVWKELMTEAYWLMSTFKRKGDNPNFYMASVCDVKEVIPCAR